MSNENLTFETILLSELSNRKNSDSKLRKTKNFVAKLKANSASKRIFSRFAEIKKKRNKKCSKAKVKTVTIKFRGKAAGLKQGGKLIRHIKKFAIRPRNGFSSKSIAMDISELNIGDSLRLSDIQNEFKSSFTILDDFQSPVIECHPPATEYPILNDWALRLMSGENPSQLSQLKVYKDL